MAWQEIRAEYVRHFLSDEFVVGRDKEARLFKSIIDTITAEDVQQVAEQLRSRASCVVKAVSHRRQGPSSALPLLHQKTSVTRGMPVEMTGSMQISTVLTGRDWRLTESLPAWVAAVDLPPWSYFQGQL